MNRSRPARGRARHRPRRERELRDAIEEANPNRVKSADALGRFLGPVVDQPPHEGLRLKRRVEHGITRYHVEGAEEREPEKGKLN